MGSDPRTPDSGTSRVLALGTRAYRLAFRAVPTWLRGPLTEQMADVFECRQRRAARQSMLRLPLLWIVEIASILRLALRARRHGRTLLDLRGAPLPTSRRRPDLGPDARLILANRETSFMDTLAQDLRFALRTLGSSPSFTIVALVTIALGIGANTALFGIVNAVLLRPLPVSEPERLIGIMVTNDDPPGPESYTAVSLPDVRDYDRAARSLEGVAGHSIFFAGLVEGSTSRMIMGEIVTGNYFEVLDVPMLAGRPLLPEDDRVAGAHTVAVISHDFWRSHFGGDREALGKTLNLNGTPYEVVGIAAPGFTGTFAAITPRLWIPVMMAEQVEPAGTNDVSPSAGNNRLEQRGYRWLSVKARLAPGSSSGQARAEIESIGASIAERFPEVNGNIRPVVLDAGALRLHPQLDRTIRSVLGLLFGIVGLVLLVACSNVANMLLARASTRGREIAVRAALGAGRGRLMRQMITESLLLALGGGALGLALGAWITALLTRARLPFPVEIPLDFGFDLRVFGFAFAVSLVTGVVFGIAPAVRAVRADLVSALRDSARSSIGGGSWLRSGLVIAQVAVSLVLLVGSALFLVTADSVRGIDLGLDADRVVVLGLALEMSGYTDQEAQDFYLRAREHLQALPGVDSASFATGLPLSLNVHSVTVLPEGVEPRADGAGYSTARTLVGPRYFETMGVPAVRGRLIDERDSRDSGLVAVVNEAFVERYWPHEDGNGKTVRSMGREWEIVGIARNHQVFSLTAPAAPFIHFAWRQRPSPSAHLLVRTSGPAAGRVAELQQELLALEPQLVFMETSTFAEMAGTLTLPLRFATGMLVVSALLAGTLASIGLYGTIAQAVASRTRELGIRKALGARRGNMIGLVFRQSMDVVGTGVIAGLILAYSAARLFSGYLYGVTPTDPLPYVAGLAVLALVLGLSVLTPARRASRVDPMVALRQD